MTALMQDSSAPRFGAASLLRNATAAAVATVMQVATMVALGTLVFSGPLAPFLSAGIGLFLFGMVVNGFLIPAFSGYKAFFSGPRTGQAPVFAAMAGSIAMAMQGQPPEAILATVIAAILVTTVFVGAVLFVLGAAKLGTLARYVPYPVMGGFFAGLGYLLLTGGLRVAAGGALTHWAGPAFWVMLAAAGFGALLFVLERRIKHWLLMPGVLLGAVVVFHAVLAVTGTSLEAAAALNWVPNLQVPEAGLLPVIAPQDLALVDWRLVLGQAGAMLGLALLSAIMLLLDVSGVEIVIDRDLDPNAELRSAGLVNIAGAALGSPLGFGASADTALNIKLGGDSFVLIVMFTLFGAGVFVLGPAPLALIPVPVVAGLLVYMGLVFLVQWTWDARRYLPVSDLVVIGIIIVTVALFGVLEGVAVGVALATAHFVNRYSRLSIIKSVLTGAEHLSPVERHAEEQAHLDAVGGAVQMFILQGYLFFGSASRLLDEIGATLAARAAPARFLVLDFRRVDGIDSSAVNSLAKLVQLSHRQRMTLCLAGCPAAIVAQVREVPGLNGPVLQVFETLDQASGWCEDTLLAERPDPTVGAFLSPLALLNSVLQDEAASEALLDACEEVALSKGEQLFAQGAVGDAMFFVVEGAVAIELHLPNAPPIVARTMRAGALFGEMALYTEGPRSAAARATTACTLLRLSKARFDALSQSHPLATTKLDAHVIRVMAERLARANKEVIALSQ